MNPLTPLAPLAPLETVGETVASAAGAATSVASSVASKVFFGLPLSSVVVIFLGLLFIAAGLFTFDRTRDLVVQAGKGIAAAAA